MIPLSHITVKYTTGDLLKNKQTNKPYKGYHMKTINGDYYEGIDNMSPGFPLVLLENGIY